MTDDYRLSGEEAALYRRVPTVGSKTSNQRRGGQSGARSNDQRWRRAMSVAVGVGVCFSVLLVSVSLGVSYSIKHRLRDRSLLPCR
jgi:hypothetical protein